MARRRKKTARNAAQRQKASANSAHLYKSLPSLPPSAEPKSSFSPEIETPPSETFSETPTEIPPRLRPRDERRSRSRGGSTDRGERSPANTWGHTRGLRHPVLTSGPSTKPLADALNIPQHPNNSRHSSISQRSEADCPGGEEFLIPVAFDPTPPIHRSPHLPAHRSARVETGDYFGPARAAGDVPRQASGSTPDTPFSAPHIVHQEKARMPAEDVAESIKKRREDGSSANGSPGVSPHLGSGPTQQQYAISPKDAQDNRDLASEEKFKLQEVPKPKRSASSARSSKSGSASPAVGSLSASGHHAVEKSGELPRLNATVPQEAGSFMAQFRSSSPQPNDYRSRGDGSKDSSSLGQPSNTGTTGQLQYPPKRGDSLESSKASQQIPRKEVSAGLSKSQESPRATPGRSSASTTPNMAFEYGNVSEKINGGKVISRAVGSPSTNDILDPSSSKTGDAPTSNMDVSFLAQRSPPSPPTQRLNEPFIKPRSETSGGGERPVSPGLPRWSAGGEFSMDEDMARILGGEDSQVHGSFLRRMSNSVRHGRSFSDKGVRTSKEHKWPRSPIANSVMAGPEIGSPRAASPEHRDEVAWVKNELRRERQKTLERDQKIAELESALHSAANIKQVNSELHEKRSTIVVLDTQKEMVIRELEVLTEHIAAAKKTGDPLDLGKMNHAVMRDFAESLQKLKDSFTPQLEGLVQKRNDLLDELSNLTQMKDKSFQEFEQLSLKNAQLAELNNQLVHQIQELYKANSNAQVEPAKGTPNGLGIYSHYKGRSQVSIDSREARPNMNEMSMMNSGSTLQQEEEEPVTVLQGPHVVNIRKGQPKKFNWKKGGQNVAKGVTKGIKGAFSSTQASYSREMQFAETAPYNSAPLANDHANNMMRHGNPDSTRPGFGLFGGNQKLGAKGNQAWKSQSNGSSPALTIDASTSEFFVDRLSRILLICLALFGSDLEARADFEKTMIPFIVTRCIEEVELRGKQSVTLTTHAC